LALLLNAENKIFDDYNSTANLIQLDLDELEVLEPSFNILTLSKQLDNQKIKNEELFAQLQTKAKELYSDLKLVEIDNQQLKNRQNILGLEVKELGTMQLNFSDNSVFETKQIREIFQLKSNEEQTFYSLKGEINKYYDSQISKGIFANPLWNKTDRELIEILNNMTDKEKAGQFFIFAIGGTSINNDLKNELEKNKPSGVIYMGYNISNKNQTTKFSNDIQLTNNKIPLFISTDQEGGVVKRVSWDSTSGEKEWINFTDEKICEQSKTRALVLHDIGVNLNYAPVVDLSILGGGFINNRTISNEPDIVIKKAKEFIIKRKFKI